MSTTLATTSRIRGLGGVAVVSLPNWSLIEGLTRFQGSGVVVVEASSGLIVWCNDTLAGWLNHTVSQLAGHQQIQEYWSLPPKTPTLLPVAPDKAGQALPVHLALLPQLATGEQLKLKVKYHWLDATHLLLLLDPFAEDIALTSAHSDFVSTVSHEFRTPLTSIKGFADTMLRYGEKLPPEQTRRFITIIKDQADRLSRLVENLLSVSKLGVGQLDLMARPVNLPLVLNRVLQTVIAKGVCQPEDFQRHLPSDLPPLWVDTDRLEQVLLNLVDNAIKYSPQKGQVTITAKVDPTEPDRVVIEIQDQGVGIAAEHLPTLFTRFSRVDNPLTRTVEGTGLGLYITRSLTLAMEGTITVSSQPGQGTTFQLTFPVATPERQEAYRRRILVEGD